MTTPVLEVRGVDIAIFRATVIHDVSFEVSAGEAVAVVGPNGSGKTTLLRGISGLSPLSRGEILLDGAPLHSVRASQRIGRGLAHVIGGHSTFLDLSVADNLRAGGYTLRKQPEELRRRIAAIVERFPALAPLLALRAGSLSGGQQHLLAVAKALVAQPRVLLIDELTHGLSPGATADVLSLLATLRDDGVAVIFSEPARRLHPGSVDRILQLDRGRVAFDGPATEGLARTSAARS